MELRSAYRLCVHLSAFVVRLRARTRRGSLISTQYPVLSGQAPANHSTNQITKLTLHHLRRPAIKCSACQHKVPCHWQHHRPPRRLRHRRRRRPRRPQHHEWSTLLRAWCTPRRRSRPPPHRRHLHLPGPELEAPGTGLPFLTKSYFRSCAPSRRWMFR